MKTLTEGKPLKLILRFALPLFVGQLFQLFYSLVDTRIVGETLGETALAAVGATSTFSDLLMCLLNGLAGGFGIIIATCFGARNESDMKKAMGGTVLLGAAAAVITSIVSIVFLGTILRFLNISEELLPLARAYIVVILAGLIAATAYNILASILRAIGDSFTPLIFLIIATVLNILLDYALILYLQMGVAGAAVATVISQAVSAVLCFWYMHRKYPEIRLKREDLKPCRRIYEKLLTTGFSMAFMTAFAQMGTFALQSTINTFGTNIIVAHTAARKISSIFMMPWGVLGTTLATYCGQNLGAGKYARIRQGIKETLFLAWGGCVVTMVIAQTLSPTLVRIITATTETEIMETAALYLEVDTLFYFVPALICLFRSSMQGFGDSKTPVFSSFLELLVKVIIAFLLAPSIGYWGIIISEPIAWIVMAVPLVVNMWRNPIFKRNE